MKHTSLSARILAFLLLFSLVFSFAACANGGKDGETSADSSDGSPDVSSSGDESTGGDPAPTVDTTLPVKVTVLNGTTGFGMAKLMQDKADGKTALNYTFDVQADAKNINTALINGSIDIAALPTNAAATLYNKTNGAVQVLALNTLGVLYVVANGETRTVTDFDSLRGKTVYCPANNPAIIFSAICEANGLAVGTDITVDTSYAEPAAVRAAIASGEIDLAVLPEPMVTIAKKANDKLVTALDLTAEWDKKFTAGSLVQGCVVIRTEFAAAHPAEVAKFLEEYAASIAYMQENVSDAAEIIVAQGVFAGAAPVAAAAIPNCNVTFVKGNDMKTALKVFYDTLYAIDPTSVGGAVPADNFYYGAE